LLGIGFSYYVYLCSIYILKNLQRISFYVEISSEQYKNPVIEKEISHIALNQSRKIANITTDVKKSYRNTKFNYSKF